jgi:hypothetical protein
MKTSGRNAESWKRINNSPGSSSLLHYAVSLAVGLHEHNEAGWRHGTKINKSSGDNRRAGASIKDKLHPIPEWAYAIRENR